MKISEILTEGWSQKYKSSINCSHPKGFSQKAHCAGKKKHNESIETEMVCEDCGMCQTHGSLNEIKKGARDSNGFTKCWPGKHAEGTKKGKNGGQVRKCVPNESLDANEATDPKFVGFMNKALGDKADPEPTTTKLPSEYSKFQVMNFDNMPGYKPAFKFGLNVLKAMDQKTRQRFINAPDDDLIVYMLNIADKKGFMPKHFVEEDLDEVTDWFDEIFADPSLNSWTDLLKSMSGNPGVSEAINPDILNPKFRHKQEIGDFTYTASIEQGRNHRWEPYPGAPFTNAGTSKSYYVVTWLYIKCFDGNKKIGESIFEIKGSDNKQWLESYQTKVEREYQNRGIASTMYAYAKMLGNDIKPSGLQSWQGQSMWKAWRKSGEAKHLTKMSKPVTGVAEGEVVPFKQPSKILTWQQVPRDILLLANDWFWSSEDNSGLSAVIDPKGFGNGTANDVKYNAAKLQQKGWTIDYNDEYDSKHEYNLRLTNKRGQTVLLPIEDAQSFTGWATGTSPLIGQNESIDADQKRVGQVGSKKKAKNISTVLGTAPKQHPFKGRLVGEASITNPSNQLKSKSLEALIQIKLDIEKKREADIAAWKQDFEKNVVQKAKQQLSTTLQATPVAQAGEKYNVLKDRLVQLNVAIQKHKELTNLINTIKKKYPLVADRLDSYDEGILHDVRAGAKDNYKSLIAKLNSITAQLMGNFPGAVEKGLNEFAPGNGGGESGRWYTDDQITDLVGDGWWNDLDISGAISKQQMIQEAQAWLDDQGYSVQVLNCKVNDDDMEWYIEGNFHNPGFAKKGLTEGMAQDEAEEYSGWRAEFVNEINFNTFEVRMINTRSKESGNFIVRPVDMISHGPSLQIETMDVHDLQTGRTASWTSDDPLPDGGIVYAISGMFYDNKPLQKKLWNIVDNHPGGEDHMPGLDQRRSIGQEVDADAYIDSHEKTQATMAKMKKGVAEGYGKYWCSTDKRWKERKGPKQTRSS